MAQGYNVGIILELTCIERRPWVLLVDSQSNPLRYNLLVAFVNRTSTVFRESVVRDERLWVHVAEEYCGSLFWFHVNTSVSKVRGAAMRG